MITRWNGMVPLNRVLSSVLLASGIVLVFAGLSAALGFTAPGMIASIAVIGTLLYTGSVWFSSPPVIAIAAEPRPCSSSTVSCTWLRARARVLRSSHNSP
jgi:hypothetical protein